jgi:hypothetical protein
VVAAGEAAADAGLVRALLAVGDLFGRAQVVSRRKVVSFAAEDYDANILIARGSIECVVQFLEEDAALGVAVPRPVQGDSRDMVVEVVRMLRYSVIDRLLRASSVSLPAARLSAMLRALFSHP